LQDLAGNGSCGPRVTAGRLDLLKEFTGSKINYFGLVRTQVTNQGAGRGEKAWRREIEGNYTDLDPRTSGHEHYNRIDPEAHL
jgi:hypothetical protein